MNSGNEEYARGRRERKITEQDALKWPASEVCLRVGLPLS